jgi:putative two-component system response regulator
MNYQPEDFYSNLPAAQILVVDDEPTNVRLLEKVLQSEGYTNVVSTTDSRQAVELYQQHRSDLILLDLNMPYLDGYQVMEELRAQEDASLPPILVLTAQHVQEFRNRALKSGASDYVTKPFDRVELLSRVHNLLQVHLAQRYMHDQNQFLEKKVRERTRELQDTRLQIVQRLGRAAEYRDNETGLHIIRMSKVSALLGKSVGLDEYQCDLLLNASPMHDIGKIGVPDEILLKPGKLEPQEWEIMKTHSQIGADILAGDDSELLSMARDIALTHHEKWDGSGYPNALQGEDIPLVGRIVALADVFDALTSDRPYKKAWSVDDALELIREQSGRHFDPRLTECFLAQLPDVLAITEKYAEPRSPEFAIGDSDAVQV